jgi:AcrR family transcriptional regulator
MLDLTREGSIAPSADQVALRAGVGLRSVFRHFSDMASLYGEMHDVIEAELRGAAARPFRGATWRERLLELIERRSAAFEIIAPFRRAADIRRRGSSKLQADHARLAEALRVILVRETPEALREDAARFEALDLLLSYEAWSRLRDDQGLSPRAARAALAAAVGALIGPPED